MQKGTIGILFDDVDMPFNKYGVRPDIILNPNAIPSKHTARVKWQHFASYLIIYRSHC
jgi:hypothetical protein